MLSPLPRARRRFVRIAGVVLLAMGGVLAFAVSWVFDWWKKAPQPSPEPFVFRDGFEDARELNDLLPRDWSRWHGAQRETPGVVVTPTTERTHSGTRALKCYAPARRGGDIPKADIERSQLRFVKGDEVWFRAWYYLVSGGDATSLFLCDLEATGKRQSPGRRLYLQSGEAFATDLGKWWTGRTVRQAKGAAQRFPKDRWVCVRLHLLLSERAGEGQLQVWQDDGEVLNAHCQTLPTRAAIYNRLQVGITAHGNRESGLTLYVDDVEISNRALW